MLRATFIALSQSKSLRSFAEKTAIGQRLSRRFVAGTTIEEALRATQAMNQLGLGVSVDNLGENVTMLKRRTTAPGYIMNCSIRWRVAG